MKNFDVLFINQIIDLSIFVVIHPLVTIHSFIHCGVIILVIVKVLPLRQLHAGLSERIPHVECFCESLRKRAAISGMVEVGVNPRIRVNIGVILVTRDHNQRQGLKQSRKHSSEQRPNLFFQQEKVDPGLGKRLSIAASALRILLDLKPQKTPLRVSGRRG